MNKQRIRKPIAMLLAMLMFLLCAPIAEAEDSGNRAVFENSFRIPQQYLTPGHEFRVAVRAAVGNHYIWTLRTFSVLPNVSLTFNGNGGTGNCTPGERCIMRLNYFEETEHVPSVWCRACEAIIRNNRNRFTGN